MFLAHKKIYIERESEESPALKFLSYSLCLTLGHFVFLRAKWSEGRGEGEKIQGNTVQKINPLNRRIAWINTHQRRNRKRLLKFSYYWYTKFRHTRKQVENVWGNFIRQVHIHFFLA